VRGRGPDLARRGQRRLGQFTSAVTAGAFAALARMLLAVLAAPAALAGVLLAALAAPMTASAIMKHLYL
jgi:hypothetical protein